MFPHQISCILGCFHSRKARHSPKSYNKKIHCPQNENYVFTSRLQPLHRNSGYEQATPTVPDLYNTLASSTSTASFLRQCSLYCFGRGVYPAYSAKIARYIFFVSCLLTVLFPAKTPRKVDSLAFEIAMLFQEYSSTYQSIKSGFGSSLIGVYSLSSSIVPALNGVF